MSDDHLSVSSKRSLSPSPPDLGLHLVRLPDEPDLPGVELYLCNFVDPSVDTPSEFLDPLNRSLSFSWKGFVHRLLQVTVPQRCRFARLGLHNDWFSHFLLYLEHSGYEVSEQDAAPFAAPKKTCSARQTLSPSPPPPVANRFEALSSMSVDVPLPPDPPDDPSLSAPKMDFKSKVPPITLRLSPAVLPVVRPLLHRDSRLLYRASKITVRASSLAEYTAILSAAAANHLEFFTHNPVVSHVSKSVLRGLPADTPTADILSALSDLDFPISAIRQMWRSDVDASGGRSRRLLPLWVLTHHQELTSSLRAVSGLLHFRVFVEDLKSKDTASQCFRCQDFGHHAAFCKFPARCNLCAASHDSRQCPSRALPSRKCSNCSGDHPASFRDCPARLRFVASLRRSSPVLPPPPVPSGFPPLPVSSPPVAVPHASSSLADLLRLLSSPEFSPLVQLLTDLLRLLHSSPHLVSSLSTLLSLLSSPGFLPVVPP